MRQLTVFKNTYNEFNEVKVENFLSNNIKVNEKDYSNPSKYWFVYSENDDLSKEDIVYIIKSKLNMECDDTKVEEVVNKWISIKEK
jgi:hypothetical protein